MSTVIAARRRIRRGMQVVHPTQYFRHEGQAAAPALSDDAYLSVSAPEAKQVSLSQVSAQIVRRW